MSWIRTKSRNSLDTSTPLLQDIQDLIEFCGEQVQRRQDTTIRTEVIRFHDLFVIDRISDINVCSVWEGSDSWIEVEDIRWGFIGMEVGIQTLKEGCFALLEYQAACV